jgi:phage-related minor tail protein
VTDHWQQEVTKAFADLTDRIEKLAQQRADIEGVLHAKAKSEEWKRRARLEIEFHHEAEYLTQIRDALDARIVERQKLVDEQVQKRAQEREGDERPD